MKITESKGKDGKTYKNMKLSSIDGGEVLEFVRSTYEDRRNEHPSYGVSYLVKLQYNDEWISTLFSEARYDIFNKFVPKGAKFRLTCELKKGSTGLYIPIFNYEVLDQVFNKPAETTATTSTSTSEIKPMEDKRYAITVEFLRGELVAEDYININGERKAVSEIIPEVIDVYKVE